MGDTPIKLFVIVVTYKGKQWYDRCFTSLRNSTLPVQTIVVDNASNDGTVEYIKEHYPEIILIESKENLGFGKGNNLALKYAYEHGCDYVFLLNQDAWLVQPNVIDQLVDIAKEHPEFGILSPMHLTADERAINMDYEFDPGTCSRTLFRDSYFQIIKDVYPTDYINAAAWLLPKKTIEMVGGFDPLFTLYGEDDDYLHRVRYHGLKIGLCPRLRIVHDHTSDNWTEEGKFFRRKANKESLQELLDINVPYSYYGCQWSYLKKMMKAWLKKDKASMSLFRFRIGYLRKMRSHITNHRTQNSKQGMSWL